MTKTKAKINFRGKVGKNAENYNTGSAGKHLQMPKGINMFIPEPDGTVYLDFMPYLVTASNHPDKDEKEGIAVKGSYWYKRGYRLHRNIGPNNDSCVCLSSVGKKCPVCVERAKMKADEAEEDDIKALNSSKRTLYVVIPKKNKKFEQVPHLFDISDFNFLDLLITELKSNPKYEGFANLDNGFTLKIRFEGKTIGKGKPFPEANRIDFLKRDEPYDESILDEVPALDDVIKLLSYKSLEALLYGADDEEDEGGKLKEDDEDDEDEEETPKKKTAKKKPVEDEEEEEEDEDEDEEEEDEEEEDEEEEEKPVRKKKPAPTSKKKPVEEEEDDEDEEEEDDDEDEDDEEEDEAPVRKKKPAAKVAETGKKKCPHGHKFGRDADKFDECEDCKLWNPCVEASEE